MMFNVRRLRGRNWCFTLNNYTVAERARFETLAGLPEVRYMVFQEEVAGTGTPHLQGYVEFVKAFRLNGVKAFFTAPRLHLERRRGTAGQASDYCQKAASRKPGTEVFESGTIQRGGFTEVVLAVKDGMNLADAAEVYPEQFVKHSGGLAKLRAITMPERAWAMEVLIFYGPTRAGKSFKAHKDYPDAYAASWPAKNGVFWWPLYDGQETVIMDEFRHQVPMDVMLRLLDRYPLKVQFKGGWSTFCSKRIVITTNIDPTEWYPNVKDVSMLRARLQEFGKIFLFSLPCPKPDGVPNPTFVEIELADRLEPSTDFSSRSGGEAVYDTMRTGDDLEEF